MNSAERAVMVWWKPFSSSPQPGVQQPVELRQESPVPPPTPSPPPSPPPVSATPFRSSPEIFSHPPPPPATLTPTSFLSSISPTIPLVSLSLGLASGLYTGASRAGLVFMAENAHRRPETVQGWYFYNKTKNYKVLLSGIKAGISTGVRLGGWTGLWVLADAGALEAREQWLSSTSSAWMAYAHQNGMLGWLGHWTDGMVAGQAVAVLASAAYRLPTMRLLAIGTLAGGTTGALQDLRDYLIRKKEAQDGVSQPRSHLVGSAT
ncbi:hypothetical protein BCV69DRAFT_301745 [Microstroma glucosiphilum]|uniref:Uncharacterized protein n=1 Tax=Pseudomicrostroma glucosiphilum TaxID=1684307 RepID=A0A316U4X5_9BASI|nr:hypothetical protein BCV69DRAFT_301745 [Pseudomicrostroma glucosiphilum]PWN18005.1 hypothetical protein BCV69DRAFT_301745 [Pseudomicrostroma glucosiphilum]